MENKLEATLFSLLFLFLFSILFAPNSFYVHSLSYFSYFFFFFFTRTENRNLAQLSSALHAAHIKRTNKTKAKQTQWVIEFQLKKISFFHSFIFRFYCCCWRSYFRLCKLHTYVHSSWRIFPSMFWEISYDFFALKIDFSNGEFRENDMGHTHTQHKNAETVFFFFLFHPIRVQLSASVRPNVFLRNRHAPNIFQHAIHSTFLNNIRTRFSK